MEHLVDIQTKQIVMKNDKVIKLGNQWDDNPRYKWFNGSSKYLMPIFDGEQITEGKKIEEVKRDSFKRINDKTKNFIERGFKFNDKTFSLSLQSQISINSILQAWNLGALENKDISYNTIDDLETVVIKNKDILNFCMTALGTVDKYKNEANIEKEKIRKMDNIYEVAKFQDERKW